MHLMSDCLGQKPLKMSSFVLKFGLQKADFQVQVNNGVFYDQGNLFSLAILFKGKIPVH